MAGIRRLTQLKKWNITQLVECLFCIQEAVSSILTISKTYVYRSFDLKFEVKTSFLKIFMWFTKNKKKRLIF